MKRISGGDGLRSGKATIAENKEGTKFKVTFEDGFSKVFDKMSSPSATRKGNWFVTLMADDEEILGLRPINAMCKAKFSNFVAGEDGIPAPFEKKSERGNIYLAFVALLNLGGEYKGMVQSLFLGYKFVEYEGSTVLKGSGRWVDNLQSFLEAGGIWDQDIPFSDNLLPTIQKMLLIENKVFGLAIKNGFVDSIMELPDQESESDDDFESPAVETANDDFESNDGFEEEEDIPF